VYFQLTSAVKRRLIEELQRFWATHPKYREDLVPNIQGKFSFKERPQHAIIVKTQGGTRVDLAADNYLGIVESYCLLTRVKDKPGISCEWVREDSLAIQANNGRFPTPPGIYYVDIVDLPSTSSEQPSQRGFYVDPLLRFNGEPVGRRSPTVAFLPATPLEGSLRLFEHPSGWRLSEGVDYTLDRGPDGALTGDIILAQPLTAGRYLTADYLLTAPTTGPHPITEMHANHTAIPGVVIAFGRRVETGDQFAVMVHDIRQPAYLEHAGRWDINLECDVMSRDVDSQQEILDNTVVYLWSVLRSRLSSSGIEITDVQMGGESEEIYDDNGDDYFYNATFSLVVQTEWSVHTPLDQYIRSASPLTRQEAREISALPDEELAGQVGNIRVLSDMGLEAVRDPFWSGRHGTFELVR
jgi:hypothetical protein